MKPVLLTVNAGSSSLKLSVFETDGGGSRLANAEVTGIGTTGSASRWNVGGDHEVVVARAADHPAALDALLAGVAGHGWEPAGIGHRIVHGGVDHVAPEVATDDVLADLERLVSLAPLHQPHNLRPVRRLAELHPDVPQVLCFDTAFHATMPDTARHFALPRTYVEQGVVRYGFHGLSYEHVVSVLPGMLGSAVPGRVVIAHLGAGSSLCAVREGRSAATTMGFSPIDGVPMATRSGAVDPGAILYLLRQGMSLDEVDELLNHRSGLLGYSGISGDMQALLASSDPAADAAVGLFCARVREAIGALTADLSGIDALVFTGGIGQNSAEVRRRVTDGLGWLGIGIDAAANTENRTRIDAGGAPVSVLVIAADEASVIAHATRRVLGGLDGRT